MVHHIVLFKLKPEVTPARVEEMMMNTRMQLLKIPEVLSIKCGKRIDPELPGHFSSRSILNRWTSTKFFGKTRSM